MDQRLLDWRCAHPHATLDEIVAAVTQEMDGLRSHLVADMLRQGGVPAGKSTPSPPPAPVSLPPPDERPALCMERPHMRRLPRLEPALAAIPAGYRLRTYLPGDEAAWAELMNTGQMGTWDVERTRRELTGKQYPQFDPEGLFILTYGPDDVMVASACAWLEDPTEPWIGNLHMVCVLPAHRGKHLSHPLCVAVLHRHAQRGASHVTLITHEWRYAAIKMYLKLGFKPAYRHPLHEEQWRLVGQALGRKRRIPSLVDQYGG